MRGKGEVEKIKDRLRPGEEVILSATQSGATTKPATFFVTNERLIMRNPGFTGSKIDSCQWVDASDYSLDKGPFRSSIRVSMGTGKDFNLTKLNNNDAQQMYEIYREKDT